MAQSRSTYPSRPAGRFQRQAPFTPPAASAPKVRKPIKIEGDTQLWVTLQRVADPESGWTKTTRAMATPAGVLVNTCSRKQGTAFAAEALCLVPGTKLARANAGEWEVVATPLPAATGPVSVPPSCRQKEGG